VEHKLLSRGMFLNIYIIYIIMKKVEVVKRTKLSVEGIEGFIRRRVTKFGSGAKVDCPKEYLGRSVYLVILKD
jgi:putative transposon-encoded protein